MDNDQKIPEPDRKGLRQFGLTTGVAIVAIFGLFFPWMIERSWPTWPWVIAAPLWFLAMVHPSWLRLVQKVWMRFSLLASRVMTPLVLGIVFFVMISPVGIFRRLMGNDPMKRTIEPNQESYRIQSKKSPDEKLEKPF
jgi:hypothetical protein